MNRPVPSEGAALAAADAAAVGAAGPGATLARLRQAKGLTVQEVSASLKFAVRQIEALESEAFDRLPGPTFVRGMIRSYARLLETDAEPMVRAFSGQHASEPTGLGPETMRVPFPDGRASSTRVYLALSALLVVAVAAVLYEWHIEPLGLLRSWRTGLSPAGPEAVVPARPAAQPSPAPAAPGAAGAAADGESPAGRGEEKETPAGAQDKGAAPAVLETGAQPLASTRRQLSFDFLGESWVQVKDRYGRMLLSQINHAGTRKIVEGEPPFDVVIGNAAKVRMSYRDSPVDLKPHVKVEVARLTLP